MVGNLLLAMTFFYCTGRTVQQDFDLFVAFPWIWKGCNGDEASWKSTSISLVMHPWICMKPYLCYTWLMDQDHGWSHHTNWVITAGMEMASHSLLLMYFFLYPYSLYSHTIHLWVLDRASNELCELLKMMLKVSSPGNQTHPFNRRYNGANYRCFHHHRGRR